MSLSKATLRAIIRNNAVDESKTRAKNIPEQVERLRHIFHELEEAEVTCEFIEIANDFDETPEILLSVAGPEPADEDEEPETVDLELAFFETRLCISIAGDIRAFGVDDAAQVVRIVHDLEKLLADHLIEEKKRGKIRQLKVRSVEAQVDAMAKRLQFDYDVEELPKKVAITVKLNDSYVFYVTIPMKNLQEALNQLEALIRSTQEMHRRGVRSKTMQTPRYQSFRSWKEK